MSVRNAEYPRPKHFLVHLSDTHLVAQGELYDAVDASTRLREVLSGIVASGARPDGLIFTGDLTDQGHPDAYAELKAIVEPVAAEIDAQVVWAMGNHDDRPTFRSLLLGEDATDHPVDNVYDLDGLRVITLDSSVPGHHYGEISDRQLDWLRTELTVPAPDGTILALHHPPVPCIQDLAVLVELRDQSRLADVLRGSDVRAILAGHLHYSTTATFAGIPVSVASSTCYTQDLNVEVGGQRGRDGAQGCNLVHVYDETIVHSVVPLGAHVTVGEPVDAAEGARRLSAAGIRILESEKAARSII
ncbi:phosphodiesterase [Rhodococcus sp. C3V]|uniref:phosphodiesterase n=1 Tax=Rhodococcus sp. C3V TaxID=3034165 RepID=UPI0023E34CAE|nr:phosphodiesterase [Rhodococcus sp. C3V]MDF3319053.1 phosphodiesterase [Rhodococcus sp. C3V]